MQQPSKHRGFDSSGGGTRTHNLRINSPIRHRSLAEDPEDALDLALGVFTTCLYLASVFTKSRPGRVLVVKTTEHL